MRYFVYAISTIVLAAVIVGAFVAGSPAAARKQALDQRRVNDVSTLHSYVLQYWEAKKQLPEQLEDLKALPYFPTLPVDPLTRQPYEYEKVVEKDLTFRLCATFDTETRDTPIQLSSPKPYVPMLETGFPPTVDNWNHGIGRICFEQTINPEFFRLKE